MFRLFRLPVLPDVDLETPEEAAERKKLEYEQKLEAREQAKQALLGRLVSVAIE